MIYSKNKLFIRVSFNNDYSIFPITDFWENTNRKNLVEDLSDQIYSMLMYGDRTDYDQLRNVVDYIQNINISLVKYPLDVLIEFYTQEESTKYVYGRYHLIFNEGYLKTMTLSEFKDILEKSPEEVKDD